MYKHEMDLMRKLAQKAADAGSGEVDAGSGEVSAGSGEMDAGIAKKRPRSPRSTRIPTSEGETVQVALHGATPHNRQPPYRYGRKRRK